MSTAPFVNFPARFAFVNPDGTLTMEALRLLRTWFDRLGGSNGPTVVEVDLLAQFQPQGISQSTNDFSQQIDPSFAEVKKDVSELQNQVPWANVQTLQNQINELQLVSSLVPARVGPGGATTHVQFNDAGAFAGDADFTWDKTNNILTLGSTGTPGLIQTPAGAAGSAGADLTILPGAGNGAGAGGNFIVLGADGGVTGGGGAIIFVGGSGGATSGDGGYVSLNGGNAAGAGNGGSFSVSGGSGDAGGIVLIIGGNGDSAAGGKVAIAAGDSSGVNAAGSNVEISASDGSGTGNGGSILLEAGAKGASSAAGLVVTNASGVALATTATGGFLTFPTCAGAPSGTPVGVLAGNVALVYDSTNNFLYIYNGGWKKTTVFA